MKLNTKNLNRRGIAMTEYLIILAIVAIGSIVATGVFGQEVKHGLARIGHGIHGKNLGPNQDLHTAATDEVEKLRRMDTFDAVHP